MLRFQMVAFIVTSLHDKINCFNCLFNISGVVLDNGDERGHMPSLRERSEAVLQADKFLLSLSSKCNT